MNGKKRKRSHAVCSMCQRKGALGTGSQVYGTGVVISFGGTFRRVQKEEKHDKERGERREKSYERGRGIRDKRIVERGGSTCLGSNLRSHPCGNGRGSGNTNEE